MPEYAIHCPLCGEETLGSVVDSRQAYDGSRRRRRTCEHCGESWTTYEIEREELRQLRADSAKLKMILTQTARLLGDGSGKRRRRGR